MPKTVLITGASSGIGKATAIYFHNKGWNVIASMRSPEKETELNKYPNILLCTLDVTLPETIASTLAIGIQKFGKIDVVVNNAGYGLIGPFEGASNEQIRKQFETNVFGLMEVSRKTIEYFRSVNGGNIVNVASMGGRLTIPLYSAYHSTKWAVEGFSESLQFELRQHRIQIKIVEPGAIKTDFYDRSSQRVRSNAYEPYAEKLLTNMHKTATRSGANPEKVAATIFKASTDRSERLRFPVGADAKGLLLIRRLVPDRIYSWLIRTAVG
jgi:NAD(P)-dependent dehydrogenase (short-subunit alcohol dehydrogenase family)